MKVIISLDDLVEIRNDKFIKILKNNNPGFIDVIDEIVDFNHYITEQESEDLDNHIYLLYSSVLKRIKEIHKSRKPIILIKESLAFIDFKIIEYLITMGLTYDQALNKVINSKNKFNISEYSDINVLFSDGFNIDSIDRNGQVSAYKYFFSQLKAYDIIRTSGKSESDIVKYLNQLIQKKLDMQIVKLKVRDLF